MDQNMARILDSSISCFIVSFDLPFSVLLRPLGLLNRMRRLQKLLQTVSSNKVAKVSLDLRRASIYGRPVVLRLERIRVIMRWYVASTPSRQFRIPRFSAISRSMTAEAINTLGIDSRTMFRLSRDSFHRSEKASGSAAKINGRLLRPLRSNCEMIFEAYTPNTSQMHQPRCRLS
jgi:hypothetical protein